MRFRLAIGVAVALAVSAASGSASARINGTGGVAAASPAGSAPSAPKVARPHAQAGGTIYFYANVGNPIPGTAFGPNPPLIRPTTLIEFEDGSWLIANLRWASWGGSTARASGISSASNCKPNCAAGQRSHDPAQLVVSHPARLLGRTVYMCFQLTIPAAPKANQHNCLGRAGSDYLYMPAAGSHVKTTPPKAKTGATLHLYSFASPSRNIWCALGDEGRAHCLTRQPPRAVSLSPTGRFSVCSGTTSCVGPSGFSSSIPTLHYGQQDLAAGYRCRSEQIGVTCVYAKSGKGFLINRAGVTGVGH